MTVFELQGMESDSSCDSSSDGVTVLFGQPLGLNFLGKIPFPERPLPSLGLWVRICFPTPPSFYLLSGERPHGPWRVGQECRFGSQIFTPAHGPYMTFHKILSSSNFNCFTYKTEKQEALKRLNERM